MKYFISFLILPFVLSAETKAPKKEKTVEKKTVETLMKNIKKRITKYHWDYSMFPDDGWKTSSIYSTDGNPLLYYTCGDPDEDNRSLILSAVHGDEITPVYYGFRLVEWLKARPEICEDRFVVVAPIVNPDGFLRYRSGTRTNYNKVDLNRNFSTPEWKEHAHHLWDKKYKKRRRYYPGAEPDSEPETMFQKWLITNFKPKKILSVHAPLNFLDYDGPKSKIEEEFTEEYLNSCKELKYKIMEATPGLRYHAYGTFPGSLGNYAGKWLGIPTLTAELPTIQGRKAGAYFGLLEKGTRKFIEFEVNGRPKKLDKKIAENELNYHRHQ
jgi:protein MpaA